MNAGKQRVSTPKRFAAIFGITALLMAGIYLFNRDPGMNRNPINLPTPSFSNLTPEIPPNQPVSDTVKSRIRDNYGKLPMRFEANDGQTDQQVKFLSRGRGYTLFLTPQEVVLSLHKSQPHPSAEAEENGDWLSKSDTNSRSNGYKLFSASPR